MFDPLLYLIVAVVALTMFFGTVPRAVAAITRDRERINRLLDLYTDVFAAGAAAIIGALRIFRRKDGAPELPPTTTRKLPPTEQ